MLPLAGDTVGSGPRALCVRAYPEDAAIRVRGQLVGTDDVVVVVPELADSKQVRGHREAHAGGGQQASSATCSTVSKLSVQARSSPETSVR